MKTAVIYARYSSSSQTEQSIEGQLSVCNKYAKDNDLIIVDTYIDRAVTGTNDNRVAFQQMLSDSEKKASWEIVLVYAIDRFGRNSTEIAVNKQKLKKNGKTLISATQRTSVNIDGSRNLDGILLENVYIGIAEYYSAELSEKIIRGQSENRKKGLHCGGNIAYGYASVDRKLIIKEDEAEVVRFIYQQYGNGIYVSEIIEALTSKGIMYKGAPFRPSCIYSILRNEKYVGIYEFKGEIYTDIYPQIISVEACAKVKARAKENKFGRRSTETIYLLRNKLRCGYCGKPISAECGTARNGKKKYYYKCVGRKKHHNGCEKTVLKKELLEEFVINFIISELCKKKNIDNIVKAIMDMQTQQSKDNPILSNLKKEKKQVDASLANLLKAIEQGVVSKTTTSRLQELENEQEELERKILTEESKSSMMLEKEEIEAFYVKALKCESRLIIEILIKEIVLYNDKMEIYLNTPTKNGPDENRGFSFYNKTMNLRYYSKYSRLFVGESAIIDIRV